MIRTSNIGYCTHKQWLFRSGPKHVFPVALVMALFGQPNGLYLYFPMYQVSITIIILFFIFSIIVSKMVRGNLTIPNINLSLPLVLFLVFSCFSLIYAPNPAYGARILFSMFFKVLFFFGIVTVCNQVKDLRSLLGIITLLGVVFSIQGLLLVGGVSLFGLQASGRINEEVGFGLIDNNYALYNYGLLGFAKTYIFIGDITIPRCQSMFTEPGFFANFLELSIFSTLAWTHMQRTLHKGKCYAIVGIQLLALFFSLSTAGWFSVGTSFFVYALIIAREQLSKLFMYVFYIMFFVSLCFIILYFSFPSSLDKIYQVTWVEKFESQQRGTTSAEQRVDSINNTLNLFAQKPLFGWGIAQMAVKIGTVTNNVLVQTAGELGIVGLIIYITMLATIFKTMLDSIFITHKRKHLSIALPSYWIICCVIAFLTHFMFLSTNWSFFYWIALAILYVNRRLLTSEELYAASIYKKNELHT